MSVPVAEAIADGIQRFEGWYPYSRSYRNRNPGNLREQSRAFPKDADGFTVFPSLVMGYSALVQDLTDKISGNNTHGLGPDSTLEDLFQVYAPSEDQNHPRFYANFVASWLARVYSRWEITQQSTFREIFSIAGQDLPHGVISPANPA